MNRAARRAQASLSRELRSSRPETLTRVPDDECREKFANKPAHWARPLEVWQSRDFVVLVFAPTPNEGQSPQCRMSVTRTTFRGDGRTDDGITWDELQGLKRSIGRGEQYALEVYPRDSDIVNIANMRHLWLFEEPMDCGWSSDSFARGGI